MHRVPHTMTDDHHDSPSRRIHRHAAMSGQSMTEFVLGLGLIVLPLCPIAVRLVMALADFYNAQSSLVSLPVP